jgi:prophage DNA circulation protein
MSTPTDVAKSIQLLAENFRLTMTDPADQIRMLAQLAAYQADPVPGSSVTAADVRTTVAATAALCRRAALSSLARATSSYAPTSSDDAIAVLELVAPLYDAEILYAADAGDNNSYSALRQLRSSVIVDLQTRAAALPNLIQVALPGPVPAAVVAYDLYTDAARADDLLSRNPDIWNPLFLPSGIEALSD